MSSEGFSPFVSERGAPNYDERENEKRMSVTDKTACENNSGPVLREGYKERFLYALFPCGLLCFIYLFFGPLSLIHTNEAAFYITIAQATPWYLVAFIICCAGMTAVLALLKGSLFEGAVKFVFWLGIASYIQRNMLNPDLGLLDGHAIQWQEYTSHALINIAIWGALLLAVCAAAMLLPKQWKKIICAASAIVILMQTAALVSFYIESAADGTKKLDYYLTTDAVTQVSSNENVFVFVLDACSNYAVDRTLAAYPDALDALKDFTYYHNCGPTFYGTYPEMIATLTGNTEYDTTKSYTEYERASWESDKAEDFYDLLDSAGYTTNVYFQENIISHKYQNIEGKVDNAVLSNERWLIQPVKMFKKIGILTCWEYFPTGFKACFFTTHEDFSDLAVQEGVDGTARWTWSGSPLIDGLREEGLTGVDGNIFALYHLPGAHPPFVVDENGFVTESETSLERQMKGNLVVVEEFIAQLKLMGVYDASTIIVMGDHGDYRYDDTQVTCSAALFVKLRGEEHETMPVSNAPVTHSELLPTIAAELGTDNTSELGRTLSEIGENETRERELYVWSNIGQNARRTPDWRFDSISVYRFDYDINELNDLSSPDEIFILYDSFY